MNRDVFEQAVRSYWSVRAHQSDQQQKSGRVDAGLRGAVTGGRHLDALAQLMEDVFVAAGFHRESVRRSASVDLPGYYRPTKKWDLVVVEDDLLVAAVEFKSQVGPSFGNNFNNRTEEALGNATDVWRAYEAGTFGPVRPWLGYVFLLEKCEKSVTPIKLARTPFPVDPVFAGTSYADRYQILCRRLVRERLYDAACLVLSDQSSSGPIIEPDPELGFVNFAAAVAGRAAYIKALRD